MGRDGWPSRKGKNGSEKRSFSCKNSKKNASPEIRKEDEESIFRALSVALPRGREPSSKKIVWEGCREKSLRHSHGESLQESDSSSWSTTEPTEEGFSDKEEEEDDREYEDEEIGVRKDHKGRFFAPSSVVGSSVSGTPLTGEFCSKNPANTSPVSLNPGLISSYINIAPLPMFKGDSTECPVAHLSRFARVCRANNATAADMMMRIFPVTLDGEAGLWYELNIEPRQDISWDEIASLFVKTFQRIESFDQFRSELLMIRQAPGETVNAYYLRIQWLLKKWPEHGIPESMIKGILIDGLREDYQDWIIPQGPSSLEDALRLASTWEQAQIIKARRKTYLGNDNREITTYGSSEQTHGKTGKLDRAIMPIKDSRKNVAVDEKPGTMRCEFCDGPHDEERCEIKKEMRELWRKMKGDEEKRREGVAAGKGAEDTIEMAEGSPGGSARRERGGAILGLERRRSMCQCWKHQCWKRNERGSVVLDRTPSTSDKG